MDDIVCIINRTKVDSELADINNIHPGLTFTFELEKEGKLPF